MTATVSYEPDLSSLPEPSVGPLKILYCGQLTPHGTSLHRFEAFRRLGHDVIGLDPFAIVCGGSRLRTWLQHRVMVGPWIDEVNRRVLDLADGVDLVWVDKGLFVREATIRSLRARGTTTVHFTQDLPYSTRSDPGRRLIYAALPAYDHCLVPNPGHIRPYREAGCRSVIHMPFGFDPLTHFPPPSPEAVGGPRNPVCFIGTPYGDRPKFLVELRRKHGIAVTIHGNRWRRALSRADYELLSPMSERVGPDYRETLWRSDICLGFVTHDMLQDVAVRWGEITACGSFMLAEQPREPGDFFRPDREAAFFTDPEDCARQIRRYLDDPDERARIAETGRAAVWPERSNDVVQDRALSTILART